MLSSISTFKLLRGDWFGIWRMYEMEMEMERTHKHTHTYTHIHTPSTTHTYIHTYAHIMYTHTSHTHTTQSVFVCVCVCVFVSVCECVCVPALEAHPSIGRPVSFGTICIQQQLLSFACLIRQAKLLSFACLIRPANEKVPPSTNHTNDDHNRIITISTGHFCRLSLLTNIVLDSTCKVSLILLSASRFVSSVSSPMF